MASIEHQESGRRYPLRERTLIGRSRQMNVQLPGIWVSAEHAVIWWERPRWYIRDLGSRNGTTLDGRPLETRTRYALAAGAELAFGQVEERWTLTDIDPPEAPVADEPIPSGDCASPGLRCPECGGQTCFCAECGRW